MPAQPGAVERYDQVYTRNGVASLFMACEPLAGWRHVAATSRRCRSDWALFIRDLPDGRYRDAERVVLVMDPAANASRFGELNTHSPASLYQALPQRKPSAWPSGLRCTTRPSTAPGSTWSRSS